MSKTRDSRKYGSKVTVISGEHSGKKGIIYGGRQKNGIQEDLVAFEDETSAWIERRFVSLRNREKR